MEDLEKIRTLEMRFRREFARSPRFFRAPGRVNLIGEHTDYNDGFVLPFAIDRFCLVAGAARADSTINAAALDLRESFSFDLRDQAIRRRGDWRDYIEGTARSLGIRQGADLVFSSEVPIGAGLSSSAALAISVGFALLALADDAIDKRKLAFAAQRAEHDFVGIRSGIMDQFASVFSTRGHALLLDCRSLEFEKIPIAFEDFDIIVCDSRIKHELASTEYNIRRRECEAGVEILRAVKPGIQSLRDAALTDLEKADDLLPDTIKRRCRHVIGENARTLEAARGLRDNDPKLFGRLMFESHSSLRDDYQVSCRELDFLVDAAAGIDGVAGARMTGGGFGGCTVNLVRSDTTQEFENEICREYSNKFGSRPVIYSFHASDGAAEID
ncbi:MAG: galactokinase [Pyrinomonadaceae bacterium]|nr:galactokinase [Pyrinomonadaceae bacterium]